MDNDRESLTNDRTMWPVKPFPRTKDDWIALLLFPFKAYIVLGYPFLCICVIVNQSLTDPRFRYVRQTAAAFDVSQGYFLCLVILLAGALVQAIICQRGRATQTVVFFLLGCLILWIFFPWGMIST